MASRSAVSGPDLGEVATVATVACFLSCDPLANQASGARSLIGFAQIGAVAELTAA
jgi:hypothetical protein